MAQNIKCAALHCEEKSNSLHRFPKEIERCKLWVIRAGREDLLKKVGELHSTQLGICSLHFHDRMYMSLERKRLIASALPEIFPTSSGGAQLYWDDDAVYELQSCGNLTQSQLIKELRSHDNFSKLLSSAMTHAEMDTGQTNSEDYFLVQVPETNEINNESNIENLKQLLCRVCANKQDELRSIFDEDYEGDFSLVDKIHIYLPIRVTKYDEMPIQICRMCIKKLEDCHSFVSSCVEADEKLRKILNIKEDSPKDNDDIPVTPDINEGENSKPVPPEKSSESHENVVIKNENVTEAVSTDQPEDSEEIVTIEEESACLFCTNTFIKNDKLVTHYIECHPEKVVHTSNGELYLCNVKEEVIDSPVENEVNSDLQHGESCATVEVEIIETGLTNCVPIVKENSTANEDQSKTDTPVENKEEVASGNVRFPCTYCSKNFGTRLAAREHELSQHKSEGPFLCEFCGQDFPLQLDLRNHLFSHQEYDRPYKCNKCNKRFSSRPGYLSHKISHTAKSPHLCDICGKSLKHINNLKIHRRMHFDNDFMKKHECKTCGKKFTSRFRLREHSWSHSSKNSCVCNVCGKQFHHEVLLKQHSKVHASIYNFKCSVCHKQFTKKETMLIHMKRHQTNDCFKCKQCGEVYSSVADLLSHRRTHLSSVTVEEDSTNPLTPESLTCDECGRVLSSKVSLRYHKMIHTGQKPHVCEICKKSFTMKTSLTYHMRTHTGEKPYHCGFCDDAFQSKQSLVIHERLHTGEKPFKCNHCTMAFRSRVNLNQHLVVHSEERPFVCSFCGRGFRRKDTLEVHVRTHTGERPYQCSICSRGFKQKGDCNKHLRSHYREGPLPNSTASRTVSCVLCGLIFNKKDDIHRHYQTFHGVEEVTPKTIIISTENVDENNMSYALIDGEVHNVILSDVTEEIVEQTEIE